MNVPARRLVLVLSLALLVPPARAVPAPAPPPTRAEVVRDTLHGVVIEDPYRWLEDKDSPETRAWVRAQMAYTQERLAAVPGREEVKALLARLTKLDTRSLPSVHGGRLFFLARAAAQQQSVLVMRASADAPDQVLVDPNPLASDHTVSVSLVDVSSDGRLVAFALRKGGEDETVVRLMDADTRAVLPDSLPRARYFGVAIDAAKTGCWYARWAPQGSRVWYHRFGDPPARDALVFGEGLGPMEIPTVQLSENGRWLAISVLRGAASTSTRLYVRSAAGAGPFVLATDTLHAFVRATFADDRLVIRTDWNAPNGRLMSADASAPGLANWRPLVPERADAVLDGFSVACGRVFAKYLHDVSAELAAFDLDGRALGPLPLPGLGNAGAPEGEWDGHEAYYSFSSFNRPTTHYRWDAASGKSGEWWRSPAPIRPEDYEVRQEWFTSRDGTKVPLFVVARRGIALDGSHPVLLTGYGGFDVSETPGFSVRAAAWLELGGVYALANLRGGGEFGERWHAAGMLGNKQHVFDDFLAAAQWLVDARYCTPARLGILGGSNGGLLVGAAMTQRPELFGAVLCEVPLLDMLRYQRFLLAKLWVPEYGSSDDPAQFQWLRAYSPYQHVRPGTAYPPVMFVSGDSDTRVDPLHARKMAALMQSLHGPNPVWLHYDVSLGHAGGKSVDKTIEDTADELQFLRSQLGMAPVR